MNTFPGERPQTSVRALERHGPGPLCEPLEALRRLALQQPVGPLGSPTHVTNETLAVKSCLSEAENNSEQNILVKQPFYFMLKIAQAFKVKSHLK